jgi:hypothetical protein
MNAQSHEKEGDREGRGRGVSVVEKGVELV